MFRSSLLAFAVVLLPGFAAAQTPPSHDWTGVYLGVQGGWQWHQDDFEDPIASFEGDIDFDGAIAGGHIGADRQIGHLVFGVAGDFEWADGDGDSVADNNASVFARAEANWQGSLRARLGAAFDRVLIYGTGGLAFANYDLDYTFPVQVFGIGDEFDDTVAGFTVGGGAAFAAFSSWDIWADYRFTDFGTASSDITNCCAPPPNSQEHELTAHAVRLGISRRFGATAP